MTTISAQERTKTAIETDIEIESGTGTVPGSGTRTGTAPGSGTRTGIAPGSGTRTGIAPGSGTRTGTAPGCGTRIDIEIKTVTAIKTTAKTADTENKRINFDLCPLERNWRHICIIKKLLKYLRPAKRPDDHCY
ncbi:hypothetical protein EVAR_24865_1 [Eumeta japonica]|uniref:Uncharacterized protein n=1 Tax=Eumeta variegata TaxID=151549 RepID=A0A4C1YCU7_EUMVA|nr:hypothetical protein EVAR_24865_1 [Eumeta japonica]